MKRGGTHENGSALLLVMVTAVVAAILFASLYGVLLNEHKQTLIHELQVQAEYKAQTLMDVAMYDASQPAPADGTPPLFTQKFPNGNGCIDETGDPVVQTAYPNVCLKTDAGGNQTLIATGTAKLSNQVGIQTYTLTYTLPPLDGNDNRDRDATSTRP